MKRTDQIHCVSKGLLGEGVESGKKNTLSYIENKNNKREKNKIYTNDIMC